MLSGSLLSGGGVTVDVAGVVAQGQNIGRRAADIARGDRVVTAGDHLTPARIGALAAVGVTAVDLFARPRVAILSTGNEVVEPGQALAPGQIFDVNRFTLAAVVSAHGGVPEAHRAAVVARPEYGQPTVAFDEDCGVSVIVVEQAPDDVVLLDAAGRGDGFDSDLPLAVDPRSILV